MKTIISMLASMALLLSFTQPAMSETLREAIEAERIIVNWSPNGQVAGRAIVYLCPSCEPKSMQFDQDTELLIDGQPRPLNEIASKVDWAGVVTVTNQAPDQIIKFSLY